MITSLVDNGNYSTNGDDMMGDGIYSGKYVLNTNVECKVTYTFYAEIEDMSISNEIQISIIPPFTEQELSDMEYVDNIIGAVLTEYAMPNTFTSVPHEYLQNDALGDADPNYITLFQKKNNALFETLTNLVAENKVKDFNYDEINKVYHCT